MGTSVSMDETRTPDLAATCRQADILVITVKERPAISKITLKGNKDLKEEDLLKGLKDIGLAEGEPFDRLSLDRVNQLINDNTSGRGLGLFGEKGVNVLQLNLALDKETSQ